MYEESSALSPSSESLSTPDVTFRLVLALYATLVLAPGLTATVASLTDSGPAGTYVTLVGLATALLFGVGVAVGRARGLPERLGPSPLAWLLPVTALLASGSYAYVTFNDGPLSGTLTALGMITAFTGVFFGLLARVMARSRYVAGLLNGVGTESEWTAGWTRRRQALAGGTGAALMLFGLAGFMAGLLPGGAVVEAVAGVAYVVGPGLMGVGNPQTYRVTDRGLERSNQLSRRLIAWDDISGVETTDTELLVRRRPWYRPTIRCALESIDDPEATRNALARYVD